MTCAGFDVPGGFLVTADAYRTFIAENKLQSTIVDKARPALKDGYPAFDDCSEQISELILNCADNRILTAHIEIGLLLSGK